MDFGQETLFIISCSPSIHPVEVFIQALQCGRGLFPLIPWSFGPSLLSSITWPKAWSSGIPLGQGLAWWPMEQLCSARPQGQP